MKKRKWMPKRIFYLLAFLGLVLVEILIAKFAKGMIRGTIGDVIVMFVMYCFLRCVLPESIWQKLHRKMISWWVLLLLAFAYAIEIMQGFHLFNDLPHNLPTALGTTFDIGDIISYTIGALLLCCWEIFCHGREKIQK